MDVGETLGVLCLTGQAWSSLVRSGLSDLGSLLPDVELRSYERNNHCLLCVSVRRLHVLHVTAGFSCQRAQRLLMETGRRDSCQVDIIQSVAGMQLSR